MKPGEGFRLDHERPILLLDVDGVLNSSGESPWPDTKTSWPQVRHEWGTSVCKVTTSKRIGEALLSLDVEIRWLTTWGYDANKRISPRSGLPQRLPVAGIPTADEHGKMRWKADIVVETLATGRLVLWVDDEADEEVEADVRSRAPDTDLVVLMTNEATGITPSDIDLIRERLARMGRTTQQPPSAS